MDIRKKLEQALKKIDVSSLTDEQAENLLTALKQKSEKKNNSGGDIISSFENIFEAMPYAIAIADAAGNFIKTNKFFLDLFGVTPENDHGIFDDPVLIKAGYKPLLNKARQGEYCEIPELWFNINDYYPEKPPYKVCLKAIIYPVFKGKKIENFILIIENITDKKQVESELRNSSEKYKLIFENIQDVYYESSLDGKLLEISPSVESFSKYKRNELIGANLLELYWDVSDREILIKDLQVNGFLKNYKQKLKDKDGSLIISSANIRLIYDENNKPYKIIGSLVDISDYSKTLEALTISEEKYREIIVNASDLIWEADLKGNIKSVNPIVETYLGYSPQEVVGKNIREVFTPESFDLANEKIRQKIENNATSTIYAIDAISKSGEKICFEVSSRIKLKDGKPYALTGIARNINDRKKAEEELNKTRQKYLELFESSNDIIYTMDFKGNFTSVNPMAEKILGYNFEEMDHPNMIQFITPETAKLAFNNIKSKLAGDRTSTIYEVDFLKKDGKYISLEINSQLRYVDDRPVEIFGIARDITKRKKAEEELNKTRERYMELFTSSNDIIYTMDFNGNFTSVNPMAQKLLGYHFEEMDHPNMTQFITPETAKLAFNNIQSKLKGDKSNTVYEVEFLKKDGGYVSLEINSQLRYIDGKPAEIFGIARDISIRKKAEEELNKTRQKYLELFNSSNDIVYTMDFRGNFTSVNKTAEKLLGLKFEELTDVNIRNYLTPESTKKALADLVIKLRGQNEQTIFEVDFINKDGQIVSFEVNSQVRFKRGRPFEVFGIARDITERKKANEALKTSEEKYRLIFENAPLGIMTADISGNILEINPTLLQLLGSNSPQETKNINVLSFPPMIMAGLVEKFVSCIKTGEPVVSEHVYTSKWNKCIDARIYTKPIKNLYGKITGFQTIVEDITEQKKNERQIRDALNEKEVLIREIHHRVKNNMQIIISLINMQMEDSNDVIMIRKFKELQQRVRSMSIIHEDLYMSNDLSRINFGSYVDRLTNHLLQIYPHKSDLKLRFNVSEILLGIDTAIPCGLIINELLSNTFKYAFPDKRCYDGKPCEIYVEFTDEKENYRLIVSDNGIGFPPNVEELKSKSLGMLLVEILVNQLRGTMKIMNKKGVRYEIEMEKEKQRKYS